METEVFQWIFNRLCATTGTDTHIKLSLPFCVKIQHAKSAPGPTSESKFEQKFIQSNGP